MKSNEIAGIGNHYNFPAREYDPRIIQWWTPDPHAHKYPFLSPYVFCADNPIRYTDPDGRDIVDKNLAGTPYAPVFKVVKGLKAMQTYFAPFLKDNKTNYSLNYKSLGDPRTEGSGQTNWEGRRPNPSAYTDNNSDNVNSYGSTFYISQAGMALNSIHEGLHAYILNQMNAGNIRVSRADDQEHDYLATNYRSVIKSALSEYSETQKLGLSTEDIEALSWVGLETTNAFDKAFPTDALKRAQMQKESKLIYTTKPPEKPAEGSSGTTGSGTGTDGGSDTGDKKTGDGH